MLNFKKTAYLIALVSCLLFSCGKNNPPSEEKEVISIECFDAKRTKYTLDDIFDEYVCNGGLTVSVTYNDYSERNLNKNEFSWSIKDSSKKVIDSSTYFSIAGEYEVSVSYKNVTTTYAITVKEGSAYKLLSIAASDYTSQVLLNSSYSFDGIINAFFDNGTEKAVTSYSKFGEIDTSSLGEKVLNVSYKEGRITKTIDVKIYVIPSPSYKDNEIRLKFPSYGQVVDAYDQRYSQYLNAGNENEMIVALDKYSFSTPLAKTVTLSWDSNNSNEYIVHISKDTSFNNEETYRTKSNSLLLRNLIPSTTYYWKISGTKFDDESKVNMFTTSSGTVRFVGAGSVQNIRDFGGWKAENNKTIKYNQLYRGNCLNGYAGLATLDSVGKTIFNDQLKINTEIDLRTQNVDDNNQNKNFFNETKPYIKATISQYTYVLDAQSFADLKQRKGAEFVGNGSPSLSSAASIKTILETLANPLSYPVYMHCNVGADRTGTMSLLIGGLLGVAYDDLMKDYELTSFSSASGKRYRASVVDGSFNKDSIFKSSKDGNFIAMQVYYDALMYYYSNGGTFQKACENFVKNFANVSDNVISQIKDNLLA